MECSVFFVGCSSKVCHLLLTNMFHALFPIRIPKIVYQMCSIQQVTGVKFNGLLFNVTFSKIAYLVTVVNVIQGNNAYFD